MQEISFTCPKSQNKNNLILLLQHPPQGEGQDEGIEHQSNHLFESPYNNVLILLSFQLKASSGIAYYPEGGQSMDALLTTGDQNMYKNKQQRIVPIEKP
jgi:GGDEF domain-containing protein